MEFTAHLVLAFREATGSREVRVQVAVGKMFAPILDGGLSTFVGIIILAASPFGFVRKYFFGIFMAVIVLGLFNGLALVPVILSWLGPSSFVQRGAGHKEVKMVASAATVQREVEMAKVPSSPSEPFHASSQRLAAEPPAQ